jgi:hypothetical protein
VLAPMPPMRPARWKTKSTGFSVKNLRRGLIAQIKVLGRRRKNARMAVAAQTLNERLADHPAPTSDEYPRRFFHVDPGL